MPKKNKSSKSEANPNEPVKTPRRRSTTAKKQSASKSTAPAKTKAPTPAASITREPTDEEIQLRAYFIAERRQRLALEGDSNSDWLDAKRQLLSELGPR